MTTKQKALKGLLILAVVLAACMFFARTLQTITTPKVQKIKPVRGKLEEKISLQGEVHFSGGEDIVIPEAAGLGATVAKVTAREGYQVKKGDLLLTLTAGEFDGKMETLKGEYDKATRELVDEVAKSVRLLQSSGHNNVYNALLAANDLQYEKQYAAQALAQKLGFDLPSDIRAWGPPPKPSDNKNKRVGPPLDIKQIEKPAEDKYPGLAKAIDEAYEAYLAVYQKQEELLNLYTGVGDIKRESNSTFEYIKKRDGLAERVQKTAEKMLALEKKQQAMAEIRAPHDGFLTKFSLKTGDAYDGAKPLYTLSKEGETPGLRCDITDIKKTLRKGMKVAVEGISKELTISDIRLETDSRKYAYIDLTAKQISELGGLSSLMEKKVPLSIIYKADKTTTLLPASALRTDNDGSPYVFIIQQQYGGMLSNNQSTVKKTPVTLVEKSDKMVSITDELSYNEIADQEDRTISDGQQVMEYVD